MNGLNHFISFQARGQHFSSLIKNFQNVYFKKENWNQIIEDWISDFSIENMALHQRKNPILRLDFQASFLNVHSFSSNLKF